MTRIRFKALLVALAGLLGFAIAELEFYQDVEPKLRPEVSLERLVRFLESKQQQHRQPPSFEHHRRPQQRSGGGASSSSSSSSLSHQQHLIELARQKQRGLLRDDLPERPNIIDVLQREAADPLEYVRELERQRLLPYLEYEPASRIKPYSVEDELRARLLPSAPLSKDPMLDYPETHYVDLERARELENARRIEEAYRRRPQFTYAFDKPEPRVGGPPPPFVGPNDPRYYEDGPFDREPSDEFIPHGHQHRGSSKPHDKHPPSHQEQQKNDESSMTQQEQQVVMTPATLARDEEGDGPKEEFADVGVLPEPQRRAEQDPMVISLDHKANNDIFFIAIVAGCSAAAMFALVLISLTWCRFQRVSKAAADVEYPAYGVTGPNKDISPSGDQRLAQSAQMYHFQHQKQQIIGMEKASTIRDPGSVSEVESDEENEEGDYTVYECPGLAPTGEMEVKNPLFHDDPTPATPVKSIKREEDSDDDL